MQKHGRPDHVTFITRIYAFLLDYVVIAIYLFLLVGLSFWGEPILIPLFESNPLTAELTGFVLITLPVYLYFALSEGSKSHATWGKRKMGIEVALVNGQPFGLGNALFRSALKFIPWELAHFTIWHLIFPSGYPDSVIYCLFIAVYGLALSYLISPFLNKNKRTVYDFVARTIVRYKA